MDYKIETIAEHSFVPSLFDFSDHYDNPGFVDVLDCGCRGFEFAKALEKIGAKVWGIDADYLDRVIYDRVALTDFNGTGYLIISNDKQATRVIKEPITQFEVEVPCVTLEFLSLQYKVAFWDLIKLDIEGSEYEVIMSMERPYAKQLSIEFHLHTGIYGQHEMTMMEDKLKALGYEAIKHDYTSQHGVGFNYWDSLFILK